MKLTYAHQDDEYTCLRYMTSDGKRAVWVGGEIKRIAGPVTVGERYPIMYQAELRCASANIDASPKDHRSHSMVHQEVSFHRAELAEWLTSGSWAMRASAMTTHSRATKATTTIDTASIGHTLR